MSSLSIHLGFDGNCEEAFRFYEQVLGGKIQMILPYGQSPAAASVPAEFANRVMHASMNLSGIHLMGADATPEYPHQGSKGFSLSLNYKTAEEATAIFAAMSEGGTVTMPLGKTFWAEAFGMLTDRFGITWMIGCERPE